MRAPLLLTSRANPRFKSLRAQIAPGGLRRTHTLLLGGKLIEAWAEARERPAGGRLRPVLWLRLEGARPHPLEREIGVEVLLLGESLMRELGDSASAPEHALLVELGPDPTGPLPGRVIVPWAIQDPGNLGAILRSAAAFGFQEALLGHDEGVAVAEEHAADVGEVVAGGPGSSPIAEADLRAPLRILVGNEGHGWRETELPAAVQFLAIPIEGVESLNAAVAAGIACYEASRRARP